MRLQYLNQADLSIDHIRDGYGIKGLSRIDYDPLTDTYIAQSDFGADGKPTAVYSFKLTGLYNKDGNPQVEINKMPLDLSQIGSIQSIRRDPNGDGVWVTTEEVSSSICHYHSDRSVTKRRVIPNNIEMKIQSEKSLKGYTFSPDGSYYVFMERNSAADMAGYSRITQFDRNGNTMAQYAYCIDRPSLINATSNAIAGILAVNNNQLLVLERGFNKNENGLADIPVGNVRIYEINLKDAQNVLNVPNINFENTTFISKNLIFNSMDSSTVYNLDPKKNRFDTIAGMSLGPTLLDGNPSLILVSADPDSETKNQTQIASFAVQSQYDSLQLHYLNQVSVPVDYTFTDPNNGQLYTIGGLSGIDYDARTDTYIVESDHQSGRYPGNSVGYSVMYRVKLTGLTDINSSPKVEFLSAQPLINENGQPISDAESIRLDPNGDGFWYTTEEMPAGIYHYHTDGSVTKIAVPENIATRAQDNLSLEGSTFAADGSYYVSMERNLTGDATGYSRITKYDANGNIVAQYAYYTDKPSTIDATSNGISEILALDNNTLLVMERGDNSNQINVTEGASRNRVRIYKVSLIDAQNVLNIENLDATNTKTMEKTKVFDSQDPSIINLLNTNETKIDNLEGMTLGPKLPDGRQSLILVSDDNFNSAQYKTQFISLVLDDGDACFLPGTFIRTKEGMVRVENIMPGDLVYSLGHNNIWQLRQVTWVGKQTATVAAYKHDDLSGYPVCIRRNAFEEGIPYADLYVTAEHCMFFNDCFVPIRMLVNGKTIFYDRSYKSYDYYHIELEKHSIISANGALTESYLDTGNRHYFMGKSLGNYNSFYVKNWEKDGAALLITQRGGAKAIFDRLNLRADQLLVQPVEQKQKRTNDPNLYLITDSGSKVIPTRVTDTEAIFELSPTIKNVRLISRTYRPCDAFGVFVDDRHELGIMVGNIYLHQEHQKQIIDKHLSGVELSGWLPQSQSHARWTSGNALIPLKAIEMNRNMILSIQIVETGSYLIE